MKICVYFFCICLLEICFAIQPRKFRTIGAYETLLSRTVPSTNKLALSHSTIFILKQKFSDDYIRNGIEKLLFRYDILRSCLSEDRKSWQEIDDSLDECISKIFHSKISSNFNHDVWNAYDTTLNNLEFDSQSPQWRFLNIVDSESKESAWILSFNHAISDQQSAVIIVNYLLHHLTTHSQQTTDLKSNHFPPSAETVFGAETVGMNTIKWAIYQLVNGLSGAQYLPNHILDYICRPMKSHEEQSNTLNDLLIPSQRSTFTRKVLFSKDMTKDLLIVSKSKNISITQILSAAVLMTTKLLLNGDFLAQNNNDRNNTDNHSLFQNDQSKSSSTTMRFLLSVSLRKFSSVSDKFNISPWTDDSIACAAGAVDYITKVEIPSELIKDDESDTKLVSSDYIWTLAKRCQEKTSDLIDKNSYVPESVRLFGLGMNIPGVDILKAVEIDAANANSLGRSYTCGLSNAGRFEFHSNLVEEVYYGTSHGRNGVLVLLSSITVDGKLCGCLQFTNPITTPDEADNYVRSLTDLIQKIIKS